VSQVLTQLLTSAVPDVYVEHARLDNHTHGGLFYILVRPDHSRYWGRFKKKYPYCMWLAFQKHDARIFSAYCPEFRSPRALVDWLSEVLGLTNGVHRFLLLDIGICGKTVF